MEHRYSPKSIFQTKVFEEFVNLSLENFFKEELFQNSRKELNNEEVALPIFKNDGLVEDSHYHIFICKLLRVLQALLNASPNASTVELIARKIVQLAFDLESGLFKPRNNSTVGTR